MCFWGAGGIFILVFLSCGLGAKRGANTGGFLGLNFFFVIFGRGCRVFLESRLFLKKFNFFGKILDF